MLSRKIVFRRPREVAIEVAEIPPPAERKILVKTSVTLISTGTELTMLSGDFPRGSFWAEITKYPKTPGYANCGVVVEVGEKVEEFRVGDRVLSYTAHSEYILVDRDRAFKVPGEVSDEEAVFAPFAMTALNGVRLADIELGESVVVAGVGLIGQMVCQFSSLSGGFPVIAVDLSRKRLKLAKDLGATFTLNPKTADVKEKVLSLTKGSGADVVFEVTGNPDVIPWLITLVRRQGRFILLSSPRGPSTLDFHDEVNWPSRIIIGAHASSHPAFETPYNPWTSRRNTEFFFDLLSAGLINVKDLITDRYPWTEAKDVYQRLLDPIGERLQVMGVLLDFR